MKADQKKGRKSTFGVPFSKTECNAKGCAEKPRHDTLVGSLCEKHYKKFLRAWTPTAEELRRDMEE